MSGEPTIAIEFEICSGDSSYKDDHHCYIVCLNERDATVDGATPHLRAIFANHARKRAKKGLAPATSVIINFPFLMESVNHPQYMKMAHDIAHAVDQTRGNTPFAAMDVLFDDVAIEQFWEWLPSLPPSIEHLEIGLCAAGKWVVPPDVWNSLPHLKKITVRTSRTADGKIGPEVEILRR